MGQKVHPEAFGSLHPRWKSTWFNEKEFLRLPMEDIQIGAHREQARPRGPSTITIKKNKNEVEVTSNGPAAS